MDESPNSPSKNKPQRFRSRFEKDGESGNRVSQRENEFMDQSQTKAQDNHSFITKESSKTINGKSKIDKLDIDFGYEVSSESDCDYGNNKKNLDNSQKSEGKTGIKLKKKDTNRSKKSIGSPVKKSKVHKSFSEDDEEDKVGRVSKEDGEEGRDFQAEGGKKIKKKNTCPIKNETGTNEKKIKKKNTCPMKDETATSEKKSKRKNTNRSKKSIASPTKKSKVHETPCRDDEEDKVDRASNENREEGNDCEIKNESQIKLNRKDTNRSKKSIGSPTKKSKVHETATKDGEGPIVDDEEDKVDRVSKEDEGKGGDCQSVSWSDGEPEKDGGNAVTIIEDAKDK